MPIKVTGDFSISDSPPIVDLIPELRSKKNIYKVKSLV